MDEPIDCFVDYLNGVDHDMWLTLVTFALPTLSADHPEALYEIVADEAKREVARCTEYEIEPLDALCVLMADLGLKLKCGDDKS